MKEYIIDWLGPALDDITEIAQYYKSTAGLSVSRTIVNRLFEEINQLIRYPYANPYARYKTLQDKGFRVLIVDHHLCFYKVSGNKVTIYRILHSSRNYIKLFR